MTIIDISLEKILAVLERAARYRRLQCDDGRTAFELEQDIYAVPVPGPIEVRADGWAKVGTVADSPHYLDVLWNQKVDRVRVQHPPEYFPPTPPSTPPLRRSEQLGTGPVTRPFIAQIGYVYTYDGVDHDADAAELMTALQGSIEGWTWRKCTSTE